MTATTLAGAEAGLTQGPGAARSPQAIFAAARDREGSLSQLLMTFISTGLLFMVFPGTFLGVWNLLQISGRESVASVSGTWIEAHGHAQIFGWVGTFILGIGFYSIPKLRGGAASYFRAAWICWVMWTVGVALRWLANVYMWAWRALLPVSALLELIAFVIFFLQVAQHRPGRGTKSRFEPWIVVVASASVGLLLTLLTNLAGCVYVAIRGVSPAFPHVFDQRYLALAAWGFLVPFVWGFSAKWMTVFLGLRPFRPRVLLAAVALNLCGIVLTVAGYTAAGACFFPVSTSLAVVALRMFEPAVNPAKVRGVHPSFPWFVRMAYGWLLVAASLGWAAVRWDSSGGIWGASRHALTVGFVAVMILSVGQRILPAFAGMRLLWSSRLMFAGLGLLTLGCTLRVCCEVIAYQGYGSWAWSVLPVSALSELGGLTLFAVNILGTFILEPSHAHKESVVFAMPAKLS